MHSDVQNTSNQAKSGMKKSLAWPTLLIPVFLGIITFFIVVGPIALNPTRLDFAQGVDPFKDYMGWVFFRNAPWTFPLGLNPSYGLELSNSVVFTDSIPLLAIFFKSIRHLLPHPFQYLGLWTLICFILQAYFAWIIVGLFTTNRWAQFFACGLLLFSPPMLWRINQHAALVGHFLILAAWYLILRQAKIPNSPTRILAWTALLSVSLCIHFSLFTMVLVMWFTHRVDLLWHSPITLKQQLPELALEIIGLGLILVFLLWQAGYFVMSSGSGAMEGYGFFRMNLLSPFDAKGWSYFMRPLPILMDYGEGYMYWGLGFLVLWPFALYQARRFIPAILIFIKQNACLILGLVMMALFAITNHIALGTREFGFAISEQIYTAASIFRASGRFFWPLFYGLSIACLFFVLRGIKSKFLILLMGLALCIQVIDSSAGWRQFRKNFTIVDKSQHDLQFKDPFWAEAAKYYKKVLLMPPQDKSLGWEQVALYAAKYYLPTNAVFFTRIDAVKRDQAQRQFEAQLTQGYWDPSALYILQPSLVLPAYFHFNPNVDLLMNLDGVTVLAPNWKKCVTCPPMNDNLRQELQARIIQIKLDKPIFFGKGQLGSEFFNSLGGSWAWPEQWGAWTIGNQAQLLLPLPVNSSPKRLTLNLRAFVTPTYPEQKIEIFVDRMPPVIATLRQFEANQVDLLMPELSPGKQFIELTFSLKNPTSPKEVGGGSTDDRRLGIGLVSATYH